MFVLLDENMDWRIVRHLDGDVHVSTIARQGWRGKENGELLQRASQKFDVFVTMDKGFEHQQNLSKYDIGVILISAKSNALPNIQPAIPKLNEALKEVKPGQLIRVSGRESR